MQLRHQLGAVIGVLGLMFVALALWIFFGSMAAVNAVQRAASASEVVDRLLDAAAYYADERALTVMAVQDTKEVSKPEIDAIAADRVKADQMLHTALEQLARAGLSGFGPLVDKINEASKALPAARETADQSFPKTRMERGTAMSNELAPPLTNLIEATRDLRVVVGHVAATLDPRINELNDFQHHAWVMSEYAQVERGVLGGFITTGAALGPLVVKPLVATRERVAFAKDRIDLGERIAELSPQLKDALKKMREEFFGNFEKLRAKIYDAGSTGDDYPVTPQKWIEVSASAVDTLVNVQRIASTDIRGLIGEFKAREMLGLVFSGLMALIGIAIVAASVWLVWFRVAAPLQAMADLMRRLSKGDLSVEIEQATRKDEIGGMGKAVLVFKENAIAKIQAEREQEEARKREQEFKEELARREAEERRLKELRAVEVDGFIVRFEKESSAELMSLDDASSHMRAVGEGLTKAVGLANDVSEWVASGAIDASTGIQTVSAATDELTSSIQEISRRVSESTNVAGIAVNDADRATAQVTALADAAQKIGEIVRVIADVASKTNLLALNATIEAARAGDAGRGFAIVAAEVKGLANQTASATEEIAGQVRSIQDATRETVDTIKTVSTSINQVNQIVVSIAAAVEEQSMATQEISRNTTEVAKGTQQVTDSVSQLTQATSSAGGAARQVITASDQLSLQAEALKSSIASFIGSVRTV